MYVFIEKYEKLSLNYRQYPLSFGALDMAMSKLQQLSLME